MSDGLTHFDGDGNAVMVDVSAKEVTERIAVAGADVIMMPETLKTIMERGMKKGDVLTVKKKGKVEEGKKIINKKGKGEINEGNMEKK